MKLIHLVLLLFSSFIFCRCIDEIKLDTGSGVQKLAVDGLIADSLQVYSIKVSTSAVLGVGNDNILTPLEGATVKVLDDAGGSFEFLETSPGVYTREMQGEAGKAYHVEVVLPDGKTILSKPEVLKKAPSIGAVSAEVVDESYLSNTGKFIEEQKLILSMNTTAAGPQQRFLRWRAEAEYEFKEAYPGALNTKLCYVKNNVDLNNISVYDAEDFAGGEINEQQVLKTDFNYRFADMFCFHLFQYAISEAEYKYWQGVNDIVNIDGSLFDPPPGTVRGNLYFKDDPGELVLGYFSVAGVAYRREFINSQTLGIFMERKCHGLSFRPQYAECMECLKILNSTTERPPYWIP
jgi:hypothetical protein